MSSVLASFLPAFLPSLLPNFLPSFLPSFLSACLPACLPSCLPSFLPPSLSPRLPSFPPAFLPCFLPSCLLFFRTPFFSSIAKGKCFFDCKKGFFLIGKKFFFDWHPGTSRNHWGGGGGAGRTGIIYLKHLPLLDDSFSAGFCLVEGMNRNSTLGAMQRKWLLTTFIHGGGSPSKASLTDAGRPGSSACLPRQVCEACFGRPLGVGEVCFPGVSKMWYPCSEPELKTS